MAGGDLCAPPGGQASRRAISGAGEIARLLILAALKEEASAVFAGRARPDNVTIAVTGIGKVNAAMTTASEIAVARPDLIIVTGTAGLIGERHESCFWIDSAVQHDYGTRTMAGLARFTAGRIPIGPPRLEPWLSIPNPGLGLPHARIASGDTFLQCPEHAAELNKALGADLIDMETAAIAQVALHHGIPWAAIRAVSDGADGESATVFRENLGRAARAAGEAVERLVELQLTDMQ